VPVPLLQRGTRTVPEGGINLPRKQDLTPHCQPETPCEAHLYHHSLKTTLGILLHADLNTVELQPSQHPLPTNRAVLDLARTLPASKHMPAIVEGSAHVLLAADLTAAFILICDSAT